MWNRNKVSNDKKYVLQMPSTSGEDMYWNDDLNPKRFEYAIFPEEGFLLTKERVLEIGKNWKWTRYSEVEWVSEDTLKFKGFHWVEELE